MSKKTKNVAGIYITVSIVSLAIAFGTMLWALNLDAQCSKLKDDVIHLEATVTTLNTQLATLETEQEELDIASSSYDNSEKRIELEQEIEHLQKEQERLEKLLKDRQTIQDEINKEQITDR